MSSFNIPWKCLDIDSEPQNEIINPPETTPKPSKTFAQALTNLCDIPLSQMPHPVVKGDRLAIEIPETLYQVGLEACKHNLHGRILWTKGSTPLSVVALKAKLSLIWKDFSKWGVISLGKGFFEFTFSTLEDVRRVRSIPSWNLNPGLLKLFAWSKDLNPRLQNNTSAQVWVRFYGLSQEYWHKNILFTIASSLGTPICTDAVTAKPMHERTFGQFARVLVDMDLSQPLRYKVLVERKGFAFFIEIDYENVPDFCNECQIIGHHIDNCRRWNQVEEVRLAKDVAVKKKPVGESKKTYVQVKENRQHQSNENNIINVEKETINVEDSSEVLIQEKSKEKEKESIVLPVLEQVPLQTLQARPVYKETAVLSPVELFKAQDIQLEQYLNANVVVADGLVQSGSDESIVNATQSQVGIASASNTDVQVQVGNASASNADVDQRQTPDRIIKDMQFLKESWAAMAEEEENLVISENEVEIQNDGFQVSMSKHQKKPFK
ncbi:hypothetical protein P8452_71581 [Trifolium repens]|nr:hypothetical protein P8452_71581 [Trifolium repens]